MPRRKLKTCKHNGTLMKSVHNDELFKYYLSKCTSCNIELVGRIPTQRKDNVYNFPFNCDRCNGRMIHTDNVVIFGNTKAGRRHELTTDEFMQLHQYFCHTCHYEINGMRVVTNTKGKQRFKNSPTWYDVPAICLKPKLGSAQLQPNLSGSIGQIKQATRSDNVIT